MEMELRHFYLGLAGTKVGMWKRKEGGGSMFKNGTIHFAPYLSLLMEIYNFSPLSDDPSDPCLLTSLFKAPDSEQTFILSHEAGQILAC